MKKGFTLIELLAVIVILAIIALITVPIITSAIQSSKEKALLNTANSLVSATYNYQAEKQKSNESIAIEVDYTNKTNTDKLSIKGSLPDGGMLKADENGKVELAIWENSAKACAKKEKNKKTITIEKITKDECTLGG